MTVNTLNVSNNPFIPGASADVYTPDQLIAGDLKLVSINVNIPTQGAVLPRGQVMGQITSSGNFIPCIMTASDGSQKPVAILSDVSDATGGAITTGAYAQGEFNFNSITFDVSWGAAQSTAAFALLDTAFRANANIYLKIPNTAAAASNA